jgi:tetratricopeptide (TPR) repeat protein
MKIVVSGVLQ